MRNTPSPDKDKIQKGQIPSLKSTSPLLHSHEPLPWRHSDHSHIKDQGGISFPWPMGTSAKQSNQAFNWLTTSDPLRRTLTAKSQTLRQYAQGH
jgi:hypothetical protein